MFVLLLDPSGFPVQITMSATKRDGVVPSPSGHVMSFCLTAVASAPPLSGKSGGPGTPSFPPSGASVRPATSARDAGGRHSVTALHQMEVIFLSS